MRRYRVVVQVLGETMAAIKLGQAESWQQMFTDGTTRQQVSFQNIVVRLMGENSLLDPIVVLSCIFMEDKTSNKQVEAIVDKVRITIAKVFGRKELNEICTTSYFRSIC